MILRFKTTETKPRYIAINTNKKTYTSSYDNVKNEREEYIEISADSFYRLYEEIDFNGYDFVNDIVNDTVTDEDRAIPLF